VGTRITRLFDDFSSPQHVDSFTSLPGIGSQRRIGRRFAARRAAPPLSPPLRSLFFLLSLEQIGRIKDFPLLSCAKDRNRQLPIVLVLPSFSLLLPLSLLEIIEQRENRERARTPTPLSTKTKVAERRREKEGEEGLTPFFFKIGVDVIWRARPFSPRKKSGVNDFFFPPLSLPAARRIKVLGR